MFELRGLLREPQHSVAVGDREQEVNRRRRCDLARIIDLDERVLLAEPYQRARCDAADAISDSDALTDAEPQHVDVPRIGFRERELSTDG